VRWQLAADDPVQVQSLAAALSELPELHFAGPPSVSHSAVDPTKRGGPLHTLAQLLIRRGLTEADAAVRFLFPCIDHLHAPEQMTGVSAAVDRLDAAIERKEPMLIYGDYDVDGTMAVIILKTAMSSAEVRPTFTYLTEFGRDTICVTMSSSVPPLRAFA